MEPEHTSIPGRRTPRPVFAILLGLLAACMLIAAPASAAAYNYSAYAPDAYDNVTVNVTTWHHVEDSGFIPWFMFAVVFLVGLVFFKWSLTRSETADICSGVATLFLWITAGISGYVTIYDQFVIDTLAGDTLVGIVIPVYRHFHPVWWMFLFMAIAVVATLHTIRVFFGWRMEEAATEGDRIEQQRG